MTHKQLPHDHGHVSIELEHEILDGKTFATISDIFKMMSDEKRVRIFWLLCHCEECVINVSALLDMSSPAVSHHLKLLKEAGLVMSRRVGKEVYYTATKTPRSEALHRAIEEIIEVACPTDSPMTLGDKYDSQIGTVNAVHDFLTADLSHRHTIEELSAAFLINQTTLKSTFKKVYGKPIAAYMKEYRIKRAAEMLCESDLPISEVAREVGYENTSKFSEAFKEVIGILPKDHRKEMIKKDNM